MGVTQKRSIEDCVKYRAGQIWRWSFTDINDHNGWDELHLLLDDPYINTDAWSALNLESGEVACVWPCSGSTDWELYEESTILIESSIISI